MPSLPYRLCDVFTDRPLSGNELAVFTHADAIDPATMQQLARELNLSECAFVLAPTVPGAAARVRICTPTMELPFAGHPTLGTAFVLAELRPELGSVVARAAPCSVEQDQVVLVHDHVGRLARVERDLGVA
ncbi:MAG: PhzF family phenazine biosynthesis isomerase [Deltaproteobacteria bacterium]